MQQDPLDTQQGGYPTRLSIDYPDRSLNRVSTFFRLIIAIPVLVLLAAVAGPTGQWNQDGGTDGRSTLAVAGAGGFVGLATLLMILFRRKYPRWWFDWNQELQRFFVRVGAYLALMDDRYPSTDDHQSVHLEYPYPDAARDLNRWLPLVKWLLAVPHYIVLFFLGVGAVIAVLVAWFAILFTGRYPRSLFRFVEGVMRWQNRVFVYVVVLATDKYPPFRLRP